MTKINKKYILKFLEDKGIEYRLEDKNIVLKHCLGCRHKEDWHAAIWFEKNTGNPNDKHGGWVHMCFSENYDMHTGFPFKDFMYICEHEIDSIRKEDR